MYRDVSNAPKGGLNSKLQAACDGHGPPLIMLLSERQMSDYKGASSGDQCVLIVVWTMVSQLAASLGPPRCLDRGQSVVLRAK
jgi:hypothetical protein